MALICQETPTSLADELAQIRAELLRLRRRETRLSRALAKAPAARRLGRWSEAEVTLSHRRIFNLWLLPPEIRQDPRYWQERSSLLVTLHPVQTQPKPRPGWPIRRDPAGVALH